MSYLYTSPIHEMEGSDLPIKQDELDSMQSMDMATR